MRSFIVAILCLLAPAVAGAGTSAKGKPYSLLFTNDGRVVFWSTGAHAGRPSCAADDRWVINTYDLRGQGILAGLMMAYASGKNIVIQGTGICEGWEGESVQYFFTVDAPETL